MRILVVDDESLARERLCRLIEELSEHSVVGEAAHGKAALEQVEALQPEVLLLDIRMPGMDGLEVARHLISKEEPPAVIFTTAYDEYALEAFKVQAVDYLLKPVRSERLQEALSKIKPNKSQWLALNKNANGTPKLRTHISARTRLGIVLVPVEEIYYFRAEHKYVTVRHKGGEVLIEDPLKEIETEFSSKFLRIHRNCLVQLAYLKALAKNNASQPCVRLEGLEECLDVSRRHVPQVRKVMNNFNLEKDN